MKLGALFLVAGIMFASPAFANKRGDGGMEWHVGIKYMRENTSFSTTGTGDANYTGSASGVYSLLKISTKERYGFGLKGGFSSRKATNTANTSSNNETIGSSVFDVGIRFYALDVFIGASAIFTPLTVEYNRNGLKSERKYNGIGAGIELGIDLFLGNNFFFSPKLEYQTISAQPGTGTTSAERLSNFGFGLGLGLAF